MSLPFNSLWFSGLTCIVLIFFVYFYLYPLKVIDSICDFFGRNHEKKTAGNFNVLEAHPKAKIEVKGKNNGLSSIIYNADHYPNNIASENKDVYASGSLTRKISPDLEKDETGTFIPDEDHESIDLSKKITGPPEVSEEDTTNDGEENDEEIQLRDL